MPTIEFEGKQIEVDCSGHLLNPGAWNETLAAILAKQDGIELTDDHLEIIYFLREYYEKYHTVPLFKVIVRELGNMLGADKGTTMYFFQLYTKNPVQRACKYAGLPRVVDSW